MNWLGTNLMAPEGGIAPSLHLDSLEEFSLLLLSLRTPVVGVAIAILAVPPLPRAKAKVSFACVTCSRPRAISSGS